MSFVQLMPIALFIRESYLFSQQGAYHDGGYLPASLTEASEADKRRPKRINLRNRLVCKTNTNIYANNGRMISD